MMSFITTRITINPMNKIANGLKPLAFGFSVEVCDIVILIKDFY